MLYDFIIIFIKIDNQTKLSFLVFRLIEKKTFNLNYKNSKFII